MRTVSAFVSFTRRLRRDARRLVHSVLDVACPEFCGACQNVATSELLCTACLADQLPQLTPRRCVAGDVPTYAAWQYTGAVKRALHRFKFESHPELARRAANAVWQCLPSDLQVPRIWVPVPLANPRLLERGYNQAALLARELAIASCSPAPRHLLRRESLQQQSGLSREQRFANALTAFAITDDARRQPPKSVILVDDVLTTGATALACTDALRVAGYSVAAVVTLAQV
jgi:ComF family protein